MAKRVLGWIVGVGLHAVAMADQVNKIPPVIAKQHTDTFLNPASGPQAMITAEQISLAGETSLAETLRQLGGLQLQDAAGNNSQVLINMRGFGANASSNTLILVNGIPITNPDLAPPNLNTLPFYNIKYIAITAGSESVLYGDQAVGGVINIVTTNEGMEVRQLICQAGSYHAQQCHFIMQQHEQPIWFEINVAGSHTDNYRQHNDDDSQLLTGSIKYLFQMGHFSLRYQLMNENLQYPGALTAEQVRQSRTQATNDTDYFHNLNGYLQLQELINISDNWQLKADVARRQMNGSGVLMTPFNQARQANFLRMEIKNVPSVVKVIAGVNGELNGYHLGSLYGLTNENLQKYDLFALATMPIQPRINVSVGARSALQASRLQSIQTNNQLNKAFASTLGLEYRWQTNEMVYLRRAESFRFPKAEEQASTVPVGSQLQTQRGVSYESGVQYQKNANTARIGIYQLHLKDEIAFDPQQTPAAPFGTNKNLSPTDRRGFSISGTRQLNNVISVTGQYNYVQAVFQTGINKGNHIPLVADRVIHAGLNYQINDKWDAYCEAVYTGSQYAANDNANIGGKLGGYTTANLNLRFAQRQWVAALHVNNVFNKYYYLYSVYQAGAPSEYYYPAPGRNVDISLQVSL